MRQRSFLLFVSLLVVGPSAFTQLSDTGLDQFGTFQRNHIQTMNLYNLNNHMEIPLFSKNERGIPFNAKLVWDLSDSLSVVQSLNNPPTCCYFQTSSGLVLKSPTDVHYNYHVVASQTCSPNT